MIFLKKLLSYFQKGVILLNVADEQQTTTKSFGNNWYILNQDNNFLNLINMFTLHLN